MQFGFSNIFPFFTRNKKGENFYDFTTATEWAKFHGALAISENHPILTPGLLFVSKIFSQAQFKVIRKNTNKEVKGHWLLDLIEKPNWYSTKQDFLESLMFMMRAQGVGVVWAPKTIGFEEPSDLFLLNYDLITFPEEIKKSKFIRNSSEKYEKYKITYDKLGENKSIKMSELLFFYDMPNALKKNPFQVKSIINGLEQTLLNTQDSLVAKNIILKSNGKEMVSGTKDGFPLTPDEKEEAKRLFNTKYGLSPGRSRGIITKASLTWKSLHIALRDLGLDESVKTDGNIIYTALHIPKDIISLEAKKTTYNNFKESMTSFLQNEMQGSLDAAVAVLNKLLPDNLKLVGTYEHLPIMQYVLLERYKGIERKGKALLALRKAGLPDDVCLRELGYDENIELNELKSESDEQQENENSEESEETKIRRISRAGNE